MALLALCSSCFCAETYLDLFTGYKEGFFKRDVDLTLLPSGDPATLDIHYKRLSIVNLEMKACWALSENLYFRADTEYGWIVGGSARRATDAVSLQPTLNGTFDSDSGHIANILGGVGYTLWPCCTFGMAPVLGWGYNSQALATHLFSNKTNWIGPWGGFDFTYRPTCALSFDLEYGFHWVRYHDYHVDIPFGAASLDFKYGHACGNTLFLKGTYITCGGYRLGLAGSFEKWHTIGKPTVDAVGLVPFPLAVANEKDHWLSYAIQIQIGRYF